MAGLAGLAWLVGVTFAAGPSGQPRSVAAGVLDEHPAIDYARRAPNDPVARLNQALVAGTRALRFEPTTGYVRAVLDALDIAEESQLLVISKTGVQRAYTSPAHPRALYFNESVIVGYIPGAPALELMAHDREHGPVFYTLDQSANATPSFTRQTSCLACHVSASTLEVPGVIARSVVVDDHGQLMPRQPVVAVNHATPHTERWGGWFVTSLGQPPPYQPLGHLGNLTATPHPTGGAPIVSDRAFIEWRNSAPGDRGYLSPLSDHTALQIFDHQAHAMNVLTRLGWEARIAASAGRTDVDRAVSPRIDELVDYLLFVGEQSAPVELTPRPGLVEHLRTRVPADGRGRSLAEINVVPRTALATDLTPPTRLFRYPCSYMIYAPAFDGLPPAVRTATYQRLFAVLDGEVSGPRYAHLTPALRREVREIVVATKSDLPAWVRASADAHHGHIHASRPTVATPQITVSGPP